VNCETGTTADTMARAARGALAAFAVGGALAGCSNAARDAGAAGVDVAAAAGESVPVTRSCARDSATDSVRTEYDVTYATRDGRPLRLDAAWPRGGGRGLVVLLHGGSWSGGSRADMHGEMLALARRGYAAASVEYRLTRAPTNLFPAAVADVRCAVRFLRGRAATYGVAPDRIAAAGFSAGAHLASMLGTAADVAGLDEACAAGDGEPRLRAVVSYAGPQDLRVNGPYTREQARIVTNFLGAFPGDVPERARLASPLAHVSAGDPPFLLVHGTADELVPPDHSRYMAASLRRAGSPATVLELRGTRHAYVGLAESTDEVVRCTTAAFLDRWLATEQ
jgi:acetyl esterase/lipase